MVGTSLSLTFTNFVIEAFVSRYLEKILIYCNACLFQILGSIIRCIFSSAQWTILYHAAGICQKLPMTGVKLRPLSSGDCLLCHFQDVHFYFNS